ncbi:MAG TPA: hypothetical protein VL172_22625, partial [Kofleriaceae bacterium]|nr:hypothetical protein [Kofleriaceae bacterium]
LPLEKVSHFRGLRSPRPPTAPPPPPRARTGTPAPLPAAPQPVSLASLAQRAPLTEDTPKPLFDAAMQKIVQRAATAADGPDEAEPDPFAAVAKPGTAKSNGENHGGMFDQIDRQPHDDSLELDIGEASRIVKLPMLLAGARDAGAAAPEAEGLPGVAKIPPGAAPAAVTARVGRGTEGILRPLAPLSDGALADAQPPILTQSVAPPRHSPLFLPLLIGGGVLVIGLAVVLIIVLGSGSASEGEELARSDVGGGELGGRDFVVRTKGASEEVEMKVEPGKPIEVHKRPTRSTGENVSTGTGNNGTSAEVPVTGPADPSLRPLLPTEVLSEMHKHAISNRRCYEYALKKDPFLDVKSIPVKIVIDPSGAVSSVTLGSQADSVLGKCLSSRLEGWQFRKSTNGLSMNLTLTFEQQ